MAKQLKRGEYNRAAVLRYQNKRLKEGWVRVCWLLPPEVAEDVRNFKNKQMDEWRSSNKQDKVKPNSVAARWEN